MTARAERESGFSLIEALIALGIVAAIVAAFFQAAGQSALASGGAADRRAALVVAQSALDRAVAGEPVTGGRDGEFVWRISRSQPEGSSPLDQHALEQVRVTVTGGNGETLISLAALRIAR